MRLPNADEAVVDVRKLRDYCLNLNHDEGQHKARLFLAALGMTVEDVEDLRHMLLHAARTQDAEVGRRDDYGQRYCIARMEVRGNGPEIK